MECPLCHSLSFIGEWITPKEFQGLTHRKCEMCKKDINTCYLVQPKEKKTSYWISRIRKVQMERKLAKSSTSEGDDLTDEGHDKTNSETEVDMAGSNTEVKRSTPVQKKPSKANKENEEEKSSYTEEIKRLTPLKKKLSKSNKVTEEEERGNTEVKILNHVQKEKSENRTEVEEERSRHNSEIKRSTPVKRKLSKTNVIQITRSSPDQS